MISRRHPYLIQMLRFSKRLKEKLNHDLRLIKTGANQKTILEEVSLQSRYQICLGLKFRQIHIFQEADQISGNKSTYG